MLRSLGVALIATLYLVPLAQAAERLSTGDRLPDRRYVVAGPRAYEVAAEDGSYPAMGFHTRGEMGGIWAPPIKLLDGVWAGIDGQWIGPATQFTSGWGHVEMALPGRPGLTVTRTDFVPGAHRGVLIGLRFASSGAAQSFELSVDAHSELMGAYPWGETKPFDQRTFNLQDTVARDGGALVFREEGTPAPEAGSHDWAAAVGTALDPTGVDTTGTHRGPQDQAPRPVICGASGPGTPTAPPRCDDTEYGKGAGGQLRYAIDVPAGGATTVWIGVAGAENGPAGALAELGRVLQDPDQALRDKIAARTRAARYSRLDLPGDRLLQQGIEWSKQNLLDSVQEARNLQVRELNAGTNYPAPKGTVPFARWYGAGWPDYPWLFATDGEYTAFAAVALGQFSQVEAHLRALRRVSEIDNGTSGKVVHEVVSEGSVYFGSNADAGNTDETAKFPSAVALVWRWTGDNDFRDEMYPFAKANMEYIFRELDADGDLWPEGLGNVERPNMGAEKLDNTVYTLRGLLDLADMARSKGDDATVTWATQRADSMAARFETAWWMPGVPQHADSLGDPGDVQIQQRHWIGATPMEVELVDANGHAVPGLTTAEHGNAALTLRETPCYGDDFGMYHTGKPGCDGAGDSPSELQAFTLNTAIAAVGEGNYGRLGTGQQQRWTTANRRLQLPDPDEQPGAMPEIAPSPLNGRSIDRPFNERPSVLQAWGAYGTVWPVVHQQLGVRPDLGRGVLEVVPQLPEGQDRIEGRQIRLGSGSARVRAERDGDRWRTEVRAGRDVQTLRIGATLPLGARIDRVRLDSRDVTPTLRPTNRGLEVTVDTGAGEHRLEVRTR